ncbi:LexA family protein [Blautia marasmi]|uniref:LexA family protein n=1 Tax=Blautia marasmi TaxID=1917868 RepID=UPI0039A0D15A
MIGESNKARGERIQKDIMEYIKQYIQQHGYPPNYREIGDGVVLRSSASVQRYISRMLADGILETDAGTGAVRALRVPGMRYVDTEPTILDRYLESERIRMTVLRQTIWRKRRRMSVS